MQICRCIGASKNAIGASFIMMHFLLLRGTRVAASLMSILSASNGGVPANKPSTSPLLNSLPTSLLLYMTLLLSPLLMSIHLVFIIFQPLFVASARGIFRHTPFFRAYPISIILTFFTSAASSSIPVTSSHALIGFSSCQSPAFAALPF